MSNISHITDELQKLDPQQKIAFLRSNCHLEGEEYILDKLTPEELEEQKDFITEKTILLQDKEKEFKEVKKEWGEDIKAVKSEINDSVSQVREGGVRREINVFSFEDDEHFVVHKFSEKGVHLCTEPMSTQRKLRLKRESKRLKIS